MLSSLTVAPHDGEHKTPSLTGMTTRPNRRYAEVSPTVFRVVWVCAMGLHGFCGAYYLAMARFYWASTYTYLAQMLNHNKIGMDPIYFPSIAIVFGCVSAVHGLFIVARILHSIRNRRCSFGASYCPTADQIRRDPDVHSDRPRWCYTLLHLAQASRTAVNAVFDRRGFFGVEGKYFDAQLLLLEILETVLQSIQAYRMSEHVPRPWLNRLLVVLLVISCLITPALHLLFDHRSLTRRAVALACDSLLDLVSSVVVPVCLIILYLPYYDPGGEGISLRYWTDDTWLVNAQNEFLLILVTSWWDLVSRVVVSFGFIASLESSISLIRLKSAGRLSPRKSAIVDIGKVAPLNFSSCNTASPFQWLRDSARGRRLQHWSHYALAAWGVIVLSLHIHAASLPNSPVCMMQLRPWFNSKPACALLSIDCHQAALHNGSSANQTEQYSAQDDSRVVRLLIRHCPTLRVRPVIRNYKSLTMVKIYNSTVEQWSTDAALTSQDHPNLIMVALVRVQFANGELPPGLTHPDFPKTVTGVQVCASNLRTLPPDLDAKWPQRLFLLLEESEFEAFPTCLFGLRPFQISFARNRFTTFPFEALGLDGLVILNMGGNHAISSLFLPSGTTVAPSLTLLNIIGINVSVLPNWFDGVLEAAIHRAASGMPVTYPLIAASGTPLCSHTAMVIDGSLQNYPALDAFPSEQLSFVMNLNHSDARALASLALCDFLKDPLYYPLASEDLRYRLA